LLESGERLAQIGSWDWDVVTDTLMWSDNLFRIYGLEPGAVVPDPYFVLDLVHPDDRPSVEHDVEEARVTGVLAPVEYRIVMPDGTVRHLRSTTAVVEEARRLVGTVQDLTDVRRADRNIAAHLAISETLPDWESLTLTGERLAQRLAEALNCVFACIWLPDGDALVARIFWHAATLDASGMEERLRSLRVARGVGLPGRVWASQEPVTTVRLVDHALEAMRSTIAAAGLIGGMAIPALFGDEVLAVLAFYSVEEFHPSARLIRSLTGIGHELGVFLDRRRGELVAPVLTPRELEVLQVAAQGLSAKAIGAQLFVSPATVRTHLEHIYAKLGVSDRASAVAKGLREGLIR
jgi:DNA-binding NarL/FixJ family response regulator